MNRRSESLLVEAETQGCFSGEAFSLAIEFMGDAATLCIGQAVGVGVHVQSADAQPIALHEANEIAGTVKAILDRPQKLPGGRSTNVVRARVVWKKGHATTEWNVKHSDIPAEEVWDILPSLSPDKQEDIRQAYEGYFDWAYELLHLAQKIVKERGSVR